MPNQRGFGAYTLLLVVAIVLASFYLYKIPLPKFIASYISFNQPTSPKPTPIPTPTPTPSPNDPNKIVASGDFHYSDYKVKYTLIAPKTGGEITGSLEGVCNGTPTGTYDGGEGGKVKGTFTAKCTAGPMDLVNIGVEVNYTGTVHLKDGKIDILWESVKPVTEKGSFTLSFTP